MFVKGDNDTCLNLGAVPEQTDCNNISSLCSPCYNHSPMVESADETWYLYSETLSLVDLVDILAHHQITLFELPPVIHIGIYIHSMWTQCLPLIALGSKRHVQISQTPASHRNIPRHMVYKRKIKRPEIASL